MYVCATASIPIAAVLLGKGVSPGAVLVFLMTGPATNAATIGVVWRTLGKRSALAYIGTVVFTALAAGLVLDALLGSGMVTAHVGPMAMLPSWLSHVSAVLLLGILFLPMALSHRPPSRNALAQESVVLHIEGMTCEHCAASVQQALVACTSVTEAHVSQTQSAATAIGTHLDPQKLVEAVEAMGFTVKSIEPDASK